MWWIPCNNHYLSINFYNLPNFIIAYRVRWIPLLIVSNSTLLLYFFFFLSFWIMYHIYACSLNLNVDLTADEPSQSSPTFPISSFCFQFSQLNFNSSWVLMDFNSSWVLKVIAYISFSFLIKFNDEQVAKIRRDPMELMNLNSKIVMISAWQFNIEMGRISKYAFA